MELKKYQLFINGRNFLSRGLDLAFNPHNGNVVGEVLLISESVLKEKKEEEEETVRVPREIILRS
jgi:hypothetical protein